MTALARIVIRCDFCGVTHDKLLKAGKDPAEGREVLVRETVKDSMLLPHWVAYVVSWLTPMGWSYAEGTEDVPAQYKCPRCNGAKGETT